ncbi:hypothetical protein ATSB10_34730 [Dyella thiooxydans]|uniref:Uncharacterized protein n=1 Tax=Dyella thiooxydans TaxID=445710 RepID=A0A160N4U3_9GAMM|nr:hypothetical protein ATSB10_34730 [Dyella thiooxydans]
MLIHGARTIRRRRRSSLVDFLAGTVLAIEECSESAPASTGPRAHRDGPGIGIATGVAESLKGAPGHPLCGATRAQARAIHRETGQPATTGSGSHFAAGG